MMLRNGYEKSFDAHVALGPSPFRTSQASDWIYCSNDWLTVEYMKFRVTPKGAAYRKRELFKVGQ